MDSINDARGENEEELHPYQVFDMIGGTSTGGIIAVMLGRLHMSLEDCETAYLALSKKIFTPRRTAANVLGRGKDFLNADGKFDGRVLEAEIKKTLRDLDDFSEEELLKDTDTQNPKCRAFVVTTRQSNTEPALLRSYKNKKASDVLYDECKVWEACRATSAAPTFFDPIKIGKFGQNFADGAMLYNNPVQLVYREASDIWPGRKALLISIGTGSAPGHSFKGNLKVVVDRMKEIVTQTERTANGFSHEHSDMVDEGLLYRFNVTHGLASIGLEEYKEVGAMADATQTYLDENEVRRKLEACVSKFKEEPQNQQGPSVNLENQAQWQNIIRWLSPLNFRSRQVDLLDNRTPDTGLWLTQSDVYQNWEIDPGNILWLSGIPGAGKTIVACTIIQRLQESFLLDDKIGIAFLFCVEKEKTEQTPVALMRSLLHQLAQQQPSICEKLRTLYDENRNQSKSNRPSLAEVSEAFRNILELFSQVYIVIDALDECPDDEGARSTLIKEMRRWKDKVHLCVTSRPHVQLNQVLDGVDEIQIQPQTADLIKYVDYRMKDSVRLAGNIDADPSLATKIKEAIVHRSNGMFLLAQLHMDSILVKATPNEVLKALNSLPEKLDDTYDRILQTIDSQSGYDRQWAERILSWIICAFRPLTVAELQYAAAILPGTTSIDKGDLPPANFLLSVCAGLVVIDQESNVARLVHYTTQEYFDRNRDKIFRSADTNTAKTCLAYLSSDVFDDVVMEASTYELVLSQNTFLPYTSHYWPDHARKCGEEEVFDEILKLFEKPKNVQGFWYCMWYNKSARGFGRATFSWASVEKSVLLCSAVFGLKTTFKLILEKNNMDAAAIDAENVIIGLAERAEDDLLEIILDAGADIEISDKNGRTALHYAVDQHRLSTTRLLLDRGANLEVPTRMGGTPLAQAVLHNYLPIAKLLLERGADFEGPRIHERSLLAASISSGHTRMVALLREFGATEPEPAILVEDAGGPIPETSDELNADKPATENEGESTVTLTPSTQEEPPTATPEASPEQPRPKINVNITDFLGRSALFDAVIGNLEITEILLRHGGDTEVTDVYGETPLTHLLAFIREQLDDKERYTDLDQRFATIKMLLDKGAKTEGLDAWGRRVVECVGRAGTGEEAAREIEGWGEGGREEKEGGV